jgi:uroporphyrinogen-III synthase
MRLLVTRPEPDAARTAAALQNRGHRVLIAPLLHIEAQDARLGLGPWAGVLATSANALRVMAGHRQKDEIAGLPLLTVGRHTAQAARACGFTDVSSADGDARALATLAADRFRGATTPLLYLAGENQASDLGAVLRGRGLQVRTVIVYTMRKVATLPEALLDALSEDRLDGVLHYSRRTAETYIDCADAVGLRRAALMPVHYCLSREVAVPLRGADIVRIAPRPDETALLQMIEGP